LKLNKYISFVIYSIGFKIKNLLSLLGMINAAENAVSSVRKDKKLYPNAHWYFALGILVTWIGTAYLQGNIENDNFITWLKKSHLLPTLLQTLLQIIIWVMFALIYFQS
jgi:hypothetical protein